VEQILVENKPILSYYFKLAPKPNTHTNTHRPAAIDYKFYLEYARFL